MRYLIDCLGHNDLADRLPQNKPPERMEKMYSSDVRDQPWQTARAKTRYWAFSFDMAGWQ